MRETIMPPWHRGYERVKDKGMGVELNIPLSDCDVSDILRPYRIAKICGCKFYLGSDAHSIKALYEAHNRFVAMTDALSLTEDDKFKYAKN